MEISNGDLFFFAVVTLLSTSWKYRYKSSDYAQRDTLGLAAYNVAELIRRDLNSHIFTLYDNICSANEMKPIQKNDHT